MTDINYSPSEWPEAIKKLKLDKLVGAKYSFPDGDSGLRMVCYKVSGIGDRHLDWEGYTTSVSGIGD